MQLLFQREICFPFSSHIWFVLLYIFLFKIYIKHPLDFEHHIHKKNSEFCSSEFAEVHLLENKNFPGLF